MDNKKPMKMSTHEFYQKLICWVKDNHPEVILDAMGAVFKELHEEESDRTGLNDFDGWINVDGSLVNPENIENIYSSENKTIVCLVSGKKLVDKRPLALFMELEDNGVFSEVLQHLKKAGWKPKP